MIGEAGLHGGWLLGSQIGSWVYMVRCSRLAVLACYLPNASLSPFIRHMRSLLSQHNEIHLGGRGGQEVSDVHLSGVSIDPTNTLSSRLNQLLVQLLRQSGVYLNHSGERKFIMKD